MLLQEFHKNSTKSVIFKVNKILLFTNVALKSRHKENVKSMDNTCTTSWPRSSIAVLILRKLIGRILDLDQTENLFLFNVVSAIFIYIWSYHVTMIIIIIIIIFLNIFYFLPKVVQFW